jgi:hypothetical protein
MNSLLIFAFLYASRVISVPILLKEKRLSGYSKCEYHTDCADYYFCSADYYCHDCSQFEWLSWSVDGNEPASGLCPVLCEDMPPIFGKCPACASQKECDSFYGDGMDAEESHMLPICNDGSGLCEPTGQCMNSTMTYQASLETWFMDWWVANEDQIMSPEGLDIPLLEMPGGGEDFCDCFYFGIDCVGENECYNMTQADIDSLTMMPFSMHDWCVDGMKCSDHQCEWADYVDQLVVDHGDSGYDAYDWDSGKDACGSHGDCGSDSFCYVGYCTACEHCWYDYDGVDGTCGQCEPLCEDNPPVYGKCPYCSSQKECDAFGDSGVEDEEKKPYPTCSDDSGRCAISYECEDAMIGYAGTLAAWYGDWFMNNPNATEMPGHSEWPGADSLVCNCLNSQAHCVIGSECYSDEDVEAMEALPFTASQICLDALKCDALNCGWASEEHHDVCHDLLSKFEAKGKKMLHKRNTQRKMKSKYTHKKKFDAVLKMHKFRPVHHKKE